MALRTKSKAQLNGQDARAILERYVYGSSVFMEIPVADLFIDMGYQRETPEAWLQKKTSEFDLNQFEPLTVNWRPDGVLAVIDGAGRKRLAERVGLQHVTCRIIEIDPVREPVIFTEMTRSRRWMTPLQTFKAEIESKNPAALEILAVLEELGKRADHHKSPSTIACVGTLHVIYANTGSIGLRRVLRTADSLPEDDFDRFSGAFLSALYLFYAANPRADEGRLCERLARKTTKSLHARADELWHGWKAVGQDGSKNEAFAQIIKKQYNSR